MNDWVEVNAVFGNVLQIPDSNKSQQCVVCPMTKQRRLLFISHSHLSPKAFDVIHANIWGPFHQPSYNGFRFFLTLVDDCTRLTWFYMMKHKFDFHHIFPCFYNTISAQFDTKIKVFRSDNAKELAFVEFFSQTGIQHQCSCIESPQ